jgi:hypothetical protein
MTDPKEPPPTEPPGADESTKPPPPFRPRLDLIGDAERAQRATIEERRRSGSHRSRGFWNRLRSILTRA